MPTRLEVTSHERGCWNEVVERQNDNVAWKANVNSESLNSHSVVVFLSGPGLKLFATV